ncbi:hypothetical protein ISN44_As07g013630 [Arabidopsis suecica]|uniref:Uncharacterized protein n=1 Tax=Arabidopsis suecica TaxID=45249 RepID=A0A8T2BST7_ARASU|nr:hypothetical protein ISN44_As07g013630 [Arabidopsis suecica]
MLPPEPPPPPDPPQPPDPPDSLFFRVSLTTSTLAQILDLRSPVVSPIALSPGPLHPCIESSSSDSLGVDMRWTTAMCMLCCQIRFECISLRCDLGSDVSLGLSRLILALIASFSSQDSLLI